MIFNETIKQANEVVFDNMTSGTDRGVKLAADSMSNFIRMRLREESFLESILTRKPLTNADLDRSITAGEKPVKLVPLEPDAPGAITVPFDQSPVRHYIRGRFAEAFFDRNQTPMFTKDVDELRVYKDDIDLRQVISDNAQKDMGWRRDYNFINGVNTGLVGPNEVVPATGTVQWRSYTNYVARETLAEAFKTLSFTPNRLPISKVLCNNVTIWDIVKFPRDEAGNTMNDEMFSTGFTMKKVMGLDFLVTIKRDLVPDGTFFLFTNENSLGRFFSLQDPTMFIEVKGPKFFFYTWETISVLLANIAGVARIDLTGNRTTLDPVS